MTHIFNNLFNAFYYYFLLKNYGLIFLYRINVTGGLANIIFHMAPLLLVKINTLKVVANEDFQLNVYKKYIA